MLSQHFKIRNSQASELEVNKQMDNALLREKFADLEPNLFQCSLQSDTKNEF